MGNTTWKVSEESGTGNVSCQIPHPRWPPTPLMPNRLHVRMKTRAWQALGQMADLFTMQILYLRVHSGIFSFCWLPIQKSFSVFMALGWSWLSWWSTNAQWNFIAPFLGLFPGLHWYNLSLSKNAKCSCTFTFDLIDQCIFIAFTDWHLSSHMTVGTQCPLWLKVSYVERRACTKTRKNETKQPKRNDWNEQNYK